MKFHSDSFKYLSKGMKRQRRVPFIKRHIYRIDSYWREYLAGKRQRPPLTCITIGGIEKEKEVIRLRLT